MGRKIKRGGEKKNENGEMWALKDVNSFGGFGSNSSLRAVRLDWPVFSLLACPGVP